MSTISVETLRTWLEEQRDVLVLDVRTSSDYQEWAIPGSLHVDAYDALKRHDPEALSGVRLPMDRAIVTVCGVGKTSQIAAEQLAAQGLQVSSLEGGMKAWSLAWNSAEIPLPHDSAQVIQIRRTGKGCLSYLIGDGESALVIDASLDPQVYLDLAAHQGWQITHVFDTHIHADHLSRSRQLAEQTGARALLPDQQRVSFPFTPLRDGMTLEIGTMHLTTIHTPGHTGESTCYLLGNQILFTGDTLFPTAVGRPDLDASSVEARGRAEALYESIQKLLALPHSTLVLAGHTSRPIPFDGVPVMTRLSEVEQQVNLLHASRADFVQRLLKQLPVTPPNYMQIVRLNEQGRLPDVPVTELEAGANRCAIS
jgi:glyoxylase-like metal-dependent hydrolase (beta-lactamase superfamily II)/rhodanese-related sulfurtransferase